MNELPDKDELDKLIELAKQPPAKGEETDPNMGSVQQWLIACNIKHGEHVITPTEMFMYYKRWAKRPLTFWMFTRQLKKLMPQHRGRGNNGSNSFYLVDPSAFDLSLDTVWEMRAQVRAERKKRRDKHNAKKAKG
jgi:hypothetical protein